MYSYQVNVEQTDIIKLIELNEIDLGVLNEIKRLNLLAISHLYLSSKQTIPLTDFIFEMLTDGLTDKMGLPAFIIQEVAATNGKIYYDRQVFNLVKHICKIYDKKELARLIYYQPTDNDSFELLIRSAQNFFYIEKEIAFKLATEICRFSIRELAIKENITNIVI